MKTMKKPGKKSATAKRNPRPKGGDLVERLVGQIADAVPSSWLDDLLTGPNRVLSGNPGMWGCPDIERLLNAVRKRVEDRARNTLSNSVINEPSSD